MFRAAFPSLRQCVVARPVGAASTRLNLSSTCQCCRSTHCKRASAPTTPAARTITTYAAYYSTHGTTRTESDSFGPLEVPADKLYGAQTARSMINFPIGGEAARMPLALIKAFGTLKKCAAIYNGQEGKLDAELSEAIQLACDEVVEGKLDDHFPLVIFQTGSKRTTSPAPALHSLCVWKHSPRPQCINVQWMRSFYM